jgi:hypothetical protein
VCGAPLVVRRYQGRASSCPGDCRRIARNQRRQALKSARRREAKEGQRCRVCEVDISRLRSDAKVCSPKCRDILWKTLHGTLVRFAVDNERTSA